MKVLRALIIEDNIDDADLVLSQLRKEGYEVEYRRVDSAEALRAAISEEKWDVVLSNHEMKGFSGLAALDIVQESRVDIPFIIISGSIGEEMAASLMRHGAVDYLMKENLHRLVPAIKREMVDAEIRREKRAAEAALAQSEERLKLALHAAGLGAWEWDLATNDIFWSPEVTVILAIPVAGSKMENLLAMIHPEDLEIAQSAYLSAAAGRRSFSTRFRMTRRDGETVWIAANGLPEYDDRGEVVKVVGTLRDITRDKSAEDALISAEERFRVITESATDAVISIDEKGTILYTNPAVEKVFGYTPYELLGESVRKLLPADEFKKQWEGIEQFIRTGERATDWRRTEAIGRRKDGTLITLEISFGHHVKDNRHHFTGFVRDVSEARAAEKLLKESEQNFRALVNSTTKYVWQLDENANLTEYPTWWEELTGQDAEQSRNYGWAEYIHPDDRERVKNAYVNALETGKVLDIDVRIRTLDGSYRYFHGSGAPIETEKGRRWICALTDTHAQSVAEERYKLVSLVATDFMFSSRIDENGDTSIDWVAGAFEEIVGYSFEDFNENVGWTSIMHPDDLWMQEANYAALLRNEKVSNEMRVFAKDGELKWVRVYALPIWDPQQDRLAGICGAVKDITQRKQAEQDLRDSEQRLRTIIDAEPECVKVLSDKGEILEINPSGVTMLGATSTSELIGRTARGIVLDEYLDDFNAAIKSVIRDKQQVIISYEIDALDGTRRTLEMIAVPLVGSAGRPDAVLSVSRDVTERLEAEQKLRRSERRIRSIFDQSALGMALIRTDGYFVETNERLCEILGYTCDELLDISARDISHPDEKAMDARIRESIQNGATTFAYEKRFIKKDGSTVWTRVAGGVVLDDAGQPDFYAVIFDDITKRKEIEQELADTRLQYADLLNTVDGIVWEADPETFDFSFVSKQAEALLGYSVEDWYHPQFWMDHVHPDDVSWVSRLCRERTSRGEDHQFEYRMIAKDGSVVWLRDHVSVVAGADGSPTRLRGLMVDITERRQKDIQVQRQSLMIEQANEPILAWDAETGIFEWNRGCEQLYGYTREEVLGKFPFEMLKTELPESREKLFEALDTDGQFEAVVTQTTKNGRTVHVDSRYQMIRLEGRRVVLQANRDITGHRNAELALRDSEARYRYLFESNPYPMWVYDVETLKFLAVNEAAVAAYGYSVSEFRAMTILDIHPPEQVDFVREGAASKLPKIYRAGIWHHVKKDDSVVQAEIISHALDFNGRAARFVLANDVTERLRAAEAVKRSEESYRELFENANDVVYTHDLEGNFLSLNRTGQRTFGYTLEEALEMKVTDVVAPEFLNRAIAMIARKVEGAPATIYETVVIAKNGRRIPLEINTRLIYENGVAVGVQGIGRDVSERRAAEAALRASEDQLRQSQKLESIGILAGGMAHDFNNMLTAINGYSDLLLRKLSAEDPSRRHVEEIRKAGERSADLTRQLLAFSRRQILQPRVLLLNEIVSDTASMLKRLIGEHIRIDIKLDPGIWKVQADPGQLSQVLMNLAINARDAMPDGGTLVIETENIVIDEKYAAKYIEVRPGRYVMLAVSDTGMGMDESVRKRVFEPFFTTKSVGRGTGLGLSTVYGIIKQSGGNIWVYSEPGQGSTFKIFLPIAASPDVEMPSENGQGDLQIGSETLLLVEDEDTVRNLGREILESCGYNVIEAANGIEALSRFDDEGSGIDLIITDIVMPEMGGRELSEQIIAQRPDMKILFTSGYTDDAILRHGIIDESTNFLQKPFTFDALTRKVRTLLDQN